jgi:transcriptional regulator with XRE-family HTH domain
MDSDELRFKHIGLSSDGAVIFCEMDNGRTYSMPLCALEQAEEWNEKAKPKTARIIDDGYAAVVEFNTGVKIDFPSDFVLHVCEPSYPYKKKGRAVSGIGARIRRIRHLRGLTLDALAGLCGIAKPNLSRIENGKVTPTFATLRTIAAKLGTPPALLVAGTDWKATLHAFSEWKRGLRNETDRNLPIVQVPAAEIVGVFLAAHPEHSYAHGKLLTYSHPSGKDGAGHCFDAEKWARAVEAVNGVQKRSKNAKQRS